VAKFTFKLLLFCLVVLASDYAVGHFLKNGLIKHHGFNNKAKVLCVGHSRSDHGIDRKRLERRLNVNVAKYALAGMDVFDRSAMLRHYFDEHPQEVEMVVYDIDFFTFNGRTVKQGQNEKQYRQLYPFIDNAEIDDYVHSKSMWPEYLARKYIRSLRFNDPKVFARAVINYFKTPEIPSTQFNFTGYQAGAKKNGNNYDELVINDDAVACFNETIKFIRSKNARIAFVFLPIVDLERDRINREYRDRVMGMVRKSAANDPGIVFLENNKKYEQSHELFYDPLHFNRNGQILATDDLASALKLWM
jgi:hypothetical protein